MAVNKKATAVAVNTEKLKAFDEALAQANKKLKTDSGTLIAKLSDRPMNVEVISSGSAVLDSLAGGGLAKGRLVEIYGPEASGKTSVALTAVGNVQRSGGTAVFVDLENALDPLYARKLGVDTDALAVAQPDYAEQALQLVYDLTTSGVVDVIVVDSVASMVPKAELEGDMEQQTIGLLARLMSRSLRKLVGAANKTGTTLIFINQIRDQIGGFSPFGTPSTTPGGKALRFYASQRVEVKRTEQVKEGKEVIGNKVRIKIVKNKIAPPFGQGETILTFGRGINRAAELIEVGPEHGVIEKPNNRTYIDPKTGDKLGSSKAEALAFLESNPEILERLMVDLKAAVTDALYGEGKAQPAEPVEAEDVDADEFDGDEDEIFNTED